MELLRALAAYCDAPSRQVADALGLPVPSPADEAELFSFQLYPYAAVYTGAEGMLGGEAQDRVAGFWRAAGVEPPPEPDHLAALLGLLATFAESDGERARHLRHALLWEHLLAWLPPWLARLDEVAPEAYRVWGSLLREALLAEAEELGPPAALPLHLRVAPAPDGVSTLLAAATSGVLVTRSDLARAARELGLGLRQGERRYALDALLSQDGPRVVLWLAGEAERQADLHRSSPPAWRPVAEHWAARARATAGGLRTEVFADVG
jgi:Nitrate reductase delta subunit